MAVKKGLYFFTFPLLVAAQLFIDPPVMNIYSTYPDLGQTSVTFDCAFYGTLSGTVSWNIPPDMTDRSNIVSHHGSLQVLNISSLRAGDRRNICCTYTENEEVIKSNCSFLNLTGIFL